MMPSSIVVSRLGHTLLTLESPCSLLRFSKLSITLSYYRTSMASGKYSFLFGAKAVPGKEAGPPVALLFLLSNGTSTHPFKNISRTCELQ